MKNARPTRSDDFHGWGGGISPAAPPLVCKMREEGFASIRLAHDLRFAHDRDFQPSKHGLSLANHEQN